MTFEALADAIGTALDMSFSEPTPLYQPKFDAFGSAIDTAFATLPIRSVADYGAVGDGITNDQTAVQNALNACSGLYILTIPPNFNCVVTGLTVPSDTILLGPGKLFLAAGSDTHVITLVGSNIFIRGVSIDGNKANNTGPTTPPSNPYAGGIVSLLSAFPNVAYSNVRIEDCTITDCCNWPVSINSTDNVSIINNTMSNSGNAPQVAQGCIHFVVTGNYVAGIADFGFATYEGCSDGTVTNNVIDSCACIGCLNDGTLPFDGSYDYWQSLPQHDIVFSGNVVTNSGAYGFIVQNATGYAPADAYNIIVDDNTFENSGISNTANASGVIIAQAQSITITNNRIRGGGTADSAWIGITGASYQAIITGNIISNGGNAASGVTAYAIQTSGFTNGLIADNYAFDDQDTPTLGYLFGDPGAGIASSGTIIRNNTFKNLLYGLTNAAFPTAASATFEGQTENENTDTTRTQDLIFVPPGGPTAANLTSSKLIFTSTNAASVAQSNSLSLSSQGNLEVSAPINTFANLGDIGVSGTYPNTGLTIGWNITDGLGEVDLVLGPGPGGGGLNIYQLSSTGAITGSAPIVQLDAAGAIAAQGELTVPSAVINGPLTVAKPSTGSNATLVLDSQGNLEVSAAINIFANLGDIGVSGTYPNTGLTIGWNITDGLGEVDLVLGPGPGGGGLKIYQLSSTGTITGSAPIVQLDAAGAITAEGELTVPSAVINGPLTITDPSSSSSGSLILSAPGDTNGVNFRMIGPGAVSPEKTIRVDEGSFQVINDAYSDSILNLDDSGDLTVTGSVSGSDIFVAGRSLGDAWTAVALTVSSSTGTITSYVCNARYRVVGKTCEIQINCSITDNGTGSGYISTILPFTSVGSEGAGLFQVMCGREIYVTGASLQAYVAADSSELIIATYDNAYPGGTGYLLAVGGTYETV